MVVVLPVAAYGMAQMSNCRLGNGAKTIVRLQQPDILPTFRRAIYNQIRRIHIKFSL